MAIDLSGGHPVSSEMLIPSCPDDPEMRDSVSFWVFDERGEVALPRVGIEAVGANWSHHGVQANVAFPDGRVFRLRSDEPTLSPLGPDGRPTVLGAGPLVFRCVEPFTTWTMNFDGGMVATTGDRLIAGDIDGPTTRVRFEVTGTMAVPPWGQGALSSAQQRLLSESVEGDLMGGARYEQLFRAVGSVTVDGHRHDFAGCGLRIRRRGVRRLGQFWGHAWQSALFPSGRAFGYIAYPPRSDGAPTFNEGYLFLGDGEIVPATVERAPWLSEVRHGSQDVSLALRTADGVVEIAGETVITTHDIHHRDRTFSADALREEHSDFPALQQAAVRYTWDGEVAIGMLERSSPIGSIHFVDGVSRP